MGKKSVVDSSFMESSFEDLNVPVEISADSPLYRDKDLQTLLNQLLEETQPTPKQPLYMSVYYDNYINTDFVMS